MSARVPTYPPDPNLSDRFDRLLNGEPVRGQRDWAELGALINHILGRGSTLVPAHTPYYSPQGGETDPGGAFVGYPIQADSSASFSYSIWPRTPTNSRLWIIRVANWDTTAQDAQINLTVDSTRGLTREYSINVRQPISGAQGLGGVRVLYTEPHPDWASGLTDVVTLTITNNSEELLAVQQLGYYELPRHSISLDDETSTIFVGADDERGVDVGSLKPRKPIFNPASLANRQSVRAVVEALDRARFRTTGSMLSWATADGDGFATTSASFVAVFEVDLAVLIRAIDTVSAEGTRQARLRVRGTAPAGTNLEARVTTQAGASAILTITGDGTYKFSDDVEAHHVDIETEDVSTSTGDQAGGPDTATVEVRSNGGGEVEINGVYIGESADTPEHIFGTDCYLWAKAAAGQVTLSGSDVTAWNNLANGEAYNDGTPPFVAPTWNASNPAFGGHPSVDFRANVMAFNDIASNFDGADVPMLVSIAAIRREDSSGAGDEVTLWSLNASSTTGSFVELRTIGTDQHWDVRMIDDASASATFTGPVVPEVADIWTYQTDGVTGTIYRGLVPIASGAMDVGTISFTRFWLCARSGPDYGDYDVAEIAAVQAAVTDAQRERLIRYMARDKGISLRRKSA